VSLRPIFPQFAAACRQFVKPAGYPRPFASFDWCPRCGQPDWAHQAGHEDRVARARDLDPARMEDMLAYLCEYSPGVFDVIHDAVRASVPEAPAEPYCVTCGSPVAIFAADGLSYRHYRETAGGDCLRFSAGHPTVLGWRQPSGLAGD
jgi:hypothetical protein